MSSLEFLLDSLERMQRASWEYERSKQLNNTEYGREIKSSYASARDDARAAVSEHLKNYVCEVVKGESDVKS